MANGLDGVVPVDERGVHPVRLHFQRYCSGLVQANIHTPYSVHTEYSVHAEFLFYATFRRLTNFLFDGIH